MTDLETAPPPAGATAGSAAGVGPGLDDATAALRRSVTPTFVFNAASQVLQFAFGVALARLLSPEDFGLLGMTLGFAAFAAVLGQLGLPKALIQAPRVSDAQERTVCTLSLAVSVVAGALLVVLGGAIADFFDNPAVAGLTWFMALNFVVNGLGTVPFARMNRALKLRELARIDPLATIAGGTASVVLAWAGLGATALVLGILAASLTRLAFYSWGARWLPRLGVAFRQVRELARFGLGVTAAAFFTTLTWNVDLLLIGRVLNAYALGIYMRALRIVTIPQTQFSLVVVRLLFPYFARIQEDVATIRRRFLQVAGVAALVALPALIVLFVVAGDFVVVIYGAKWSGAVLPLRILCLTGMFRAISTFAGPVLEARRWVKAQAILQGAYAALLFGGILFAARWGIVGVASAMGVASLLLGAGLLALLGRAIHLTPGHLARALAPGFLASTAAGLSSGILYLAAVPLTPPARLAGSIALGIAAAIAVLEGTPVGRRDPTYRALRRQALEALLRRPRRSRPLSPEHAEQE